MAYLLTSHDVFKCGKYKLLYLHRSLGLLVLISIVYNLLFKTHERYWDLDNCMINSVILFLHLMLSISSLQFDLPNVSIDYMITNETRLTTILFSMRNKLFYIKDFLL